MENQSNVGNSISKLKFLTDVKGNVVSSRCIKEIYTQMQKACAQLHYFCFAPDTWGNRTQQGSDYMNHTLMAYAEELQLCDRTWKVEAFATIKYPGWSKKQNSPNTTLTHTSNPFELPSLPPSSLSFQAIFHPPGLTTILMRTSQTLKQHQSTRNAKPSTAPHLMLNLSMLMPTCYPH